MPLTLPFLLLLLDWWPLARWSPTPGAPPHAEAPALRLLPPARLWIEKLPLFLLAAASAAVTLVAQGTQGAIVSADRLPLPVRAANAAIASVVYLRRALLPLDLAVLYPHPSVMPPSWRWAGACAVVAGLTLAAARAARRRPWAAAGWLWYLGTLVPVIGLVQVGAQATADRYTYLPLTGIFLAVAWGAGELGRGRLGPPVCAGAAALLLLCAVLTASQVARWRDSVTLLTHAIAVAEPPGGAPAPAAAAFLHNALGVTLAREGRLDEAIAQFRRCLAANPHYADALNNLGRALDAKGLPGEALPLYEQAAANDPRNGEILANLGAALLGRGRPAEAARTLREAVAADPGDAAALNSLGLALAALGRTAEAEQALRSATAADPAYAPALYHLARLMLEDGRAAEALPLLRETVRLRPDFVPARALLGEALARGGGQRP
jgi:tetratricopeptide (TPR) repeat protein